MATLEVPVRISAIDNLTGGLSNIAGHIGNINQQFAKFGGLQQSMMRAVTAIPLAGAAGFVMQQQAELDKQARLFQAFGDANEEQRKTLSALVNEIGPKIGMRQLDLLKGATEAVQAGLEPADILAKDNNAISFLERLGKMAIAANESIENLTVDIVQLANIGKFPFKSSAERSSTFEMLAGIAAAAPAFSPDKPRQHMMALSQFAPLLIPKLVGDNPTADDSYKAMLQASALQNTLAFAFRGQLGGMGLKTILQRIMSPTAGSDIQLQLSGFQYGKVMGFDASKANNPDALISLLARGGVDASSARGTIARTLGGLTNDSDVIGARAGLLGSLTDELGLKKDQRGKAVLKRGIDNYFALAQGGFSIVKFLEELTRLPTNALKDVAGLHHAPKAALLQGAEAAATYARILSGLAQRAPGAVDAMAGIRNDPASWDFQTRRLEASVQALRDAMWNSSTGAMMTSGLDTLNRKLLELANMDPAKLGAISNALVILAGSTAGIAALGFAVGALRFALAPLVALLATPLGAGTIGAMLEGRRVNEMLDWSKAADAAKARGEPIPDLPSSAMPLIPRLWNWGKSLLGGGDTPMLGGSLPPLGLLQPGAPNPAIEGKGEVIIRIDQDGNARVTGMRSSGFIGLKTGDSMTDTPR